MIARLLCLMLGHRFEWNPAQSWIDYLYHGVTCARCGYAPGLPALRSPLTIPPHASNAAERSAEAALAANHQED